jgi:hypothetical protein
MRDKRYPEEFKIEAVKQVVDKGFAHGCLAAATNPKSIGSFKSRPTVYIQRLALLPRRS